MKKLLFLLFVTSLSFANSTPCSGKKGGIASCYGAKFKCKDGSISSSKKVCSNYSKTEVKQQTNIKSPSETPKTFEQSGSAFNINGSN